LGLSSRIGHQALAGWQTPVATNAPGSALAQLRDGALGLIASELSPVSKVLLRKQVKTIQARKGELTKAIMSRSRT